MFISSKRCAAAVAALGVVALLGACAPGQVEGGDGDAPAPVETVDPAEFAGETLNYVYFTDGPDEAATRDLIAQFEEEYDVTVELEIMAYSDLITSVQARLTGGNAPDVVRLTSLTEFRGDLLVLDPYLGEDYKNEFASGPVSAVLNDDGAMIAVPSDMTLNGPFINVDLFEEAGVDLPDVENPWTWDEMVEAAKEVQSETDTPYAFAMDKSGNRVSTILSQYGTALVGPEGMALDADKAEAALSRITDLMAEDLMPRDFWLGSGTRYEGANEIFLTQDTPVYLSGNWQVGQFVDNAEFEWAVAPNPCAENCGGFPGGKFMGALAEGKNPQLAAEFIRFMNTAESQEAFITAFGALPTRVDLNENGVSYPAEQQEALDVFIADAARTPDFGFEANGHPAFTAAGTALVDAISEVVAGSTDLPTAISGLQDEITSLVDEIASW